MDGIHDLGGMDGFGPVDTTEHEDTFHHDWEGRTYTAFLAGLGTGVFGIDAFRHSIERIPPAQYLTADYYDRWLTGITRLFVENGAIDPERLRERTEAFAAGEAEMPGHSDPDVLGELAAGVAEAYDQSAPDSEAQFVAGDRVRVENHNPDGHTRCPGYLRRVEGVVEAVRGDHVLPDAAAHGDERATPVYSVRFGPEELWGDRADTATSVAADLWEPYLAPAED